MGVNIATTIIITIHTILTILTILTTLTIRTIQTIRSPGYWLVPGRQPVALQIGFLGIWPTMVLDRG